MSFTPFPDVPAAPGVPPLLGQLTSAGNGVARLAGFAQDITYQVGGIAAAIGDLPALAAGVTSQIADTATAIIALPFDAAASIAGQVSGMADTINGMMGGVPVMLGTLDGVTTGIVGFPAALAGGGAIRLITRIVGGVEAAVAIELPLLIGDPRQHPTFDRAKIGADQHVPGSRLNH